LDPSGNHQVQDISGRGAWASTRVQRAARPPGSAVTDTRWLAIQTEGPAPTRRRNSRLSSRRPGKGWFACSPSGKKKIRRSLSNATWLLNGLKVQAQVSTRSGVGGGGFPRQPAAAARRKTRRRRIGPVAVAAHPRNGRFGLDCGRVNSPVSPDEIGQLFDPRASGSVQGARLRGRRNRDGSVRRRVGCPILVNLRFVFLT